MNKCINCVYFNHIQFDSGRDWRWCKRFTFELKEQVITCTGFNKRDALPNIEDWQLLEYVQSIKPYIISFQEKAGFIGTTNVEIKKATNKDKEDSFD